MPLTLTRNTNREARASAPVEWYTGYIEKIGNIHVFKYAANATWSYRVTTVTTKQEDGFLTMDEAYLEALDYIREQMMDRIQEIEREMSRTLAKSGATSGPTVHTALDKAGWAMKIAKRWLIERGTTMGEAITVLNLALKDYEQVMPEKTDH